MFLRHAPDHLPKILEQQSENGFALAQGPTQSLRVVVEDSAGGAAFETTPAAMVEFVDRSLDLRDPMQRDAWDFAPALLQVLLEIANAFLFGPIVARAGRRIVQRQHPVACQEFIHVLIVEGGTIVAFEQQRRPMLPKELFDMLGDQKSV